MLFQQKLPAEEKEYLEEYPEILTNTGVPKSKALFILRRPYKIRICQDLKLGDNGRRRYFYEWHKGMSDIDTNFQFKMKG